MSKLEKKQSLNRNFVLQLKPPQLSITQIKMQTRFFVSVLIKPDWEILGLILCSSASYAFIHSSKIDLISCHSYSVRLICNIIPTDLTATQGSTMSPSTPPVPQFKQLSCPLNNNNQRSIHQYDLQKEDWWQTAQRLQCIKTYNIPAHFMGGKYRVSFAFLSFHNCPSFIYYIYYMQTAKYSGTNWIYSLSSTGRS